MDESSALGDRRHGNKGSPRGCASLALDVLGYRASRVEASSFAARSRLTRSISRRFSSLRIHSGQLRTSFEARSRISSRGLFCWLMGSFLLGLSFEAIYLE
jgi:hypothetical protein